MLTIDVVCPVYREEASIAAFHAALLDAVRELESEFRLHFIYVVDPSTDRSEEILGDLASRDDRITVLVMSRRFGHQAAIAAGIDASTGDAVVMLDSDLQHPPSLIPTLVAHWREGAEVVQAVRKDFDRFGLPARILSRIFYRLFENFSQLNIRTGAADFRLLSRKVATVFRDQLREQNPFFRGLITWIGFRLVYVPFTPARRMAGRSNYSLRALTAFAVNGIFSFSKLPLRICTVAGIVFSILSIMGGAVLLLVYVFGDEVQVPGWASLFTLSTFASGVNLFFLGVLGEYVGLIFDEVKGRPRYLVDRVHGRPPAEDPSPDTVAQT